MRKKGIFLSLVISISYFLLASCVSKSKLTDANKNLEKTRDSLKALISYNYLLKIDWIKQKELFLEHLRSDSLKERNSSEIALLNNSLPSFPNPPPQPSTRYQFDSKIFSKCKTLNDVDQLIVNALGKAGYNDKLNYFLFDDGFAIATGIEQINSDSSPKSPDERWLSQNSPKLRNNFKIADYFKSLFTAQPGYYRSFVFIISPSLDHFSNETYSKELYSKYMSQGSIRMPDKIGKEPLEIGTKVYVLVYEFKKMENSSEANLITDGAIDGQEQLRRTNVLKYFANGN